MMRVRVEYMGPLRAATGFSDEMLEVDDRCSVVDVVKSIASRHGVDATRHLLSADGHLVAGLLVAVNGTATSRAAAPGTLVRDGDTILLMPPIAGG